MKIHELHSPKGARKRRKQRGRGPGSGHGKTSCRGHKGLKARSGPNLRPGFEGGQMPLIRRIPKRGFRGRSKPVYQVVNLASLEKLKTTSTITPQNLAEAGLIKSADKRVKILGSGELSKSLTVTAHSFSKSAQEKIKKAGGVFEKITQMNTDGKKKEVRMNTDKKV